MKAALLRATVALVCAALLGATSIVSAQPAADASPALGLRIDAGPPPELGSHTLWIRVHARWADVERERGSYAWDDVAAKVDAAAGAHRVILCVSGSNPLYGSGQGLPSVIDGDSLDGWRNFVRSAAREFAGRLAVLELWDRVGTRAGIEARDYAFLFKTSALAARAEADAKGAELLVAPGALGAGELEWQRGLWQEDVAAYVDLFPVEVGRAGVSELTRLLVERLSFPPAPPVLAYVVDDGDGPWGAAGRAVESLAAGADAALLPADGEPQRVAWVNGAAALFDKGYAPAPSAGLRLESRAGEPLGRGRVLGRFFSAEDFSSLVFYSAPPAETDEVEDWLVVEARRVRAARSIDPVDGRTERLGGARANEGRERARLRAARAEWPMALRYQRAVSGAVDLPPEEIETRSSRELTAEEIIARHQQVQQTQDDRLERWIARGRVDYHFKLAQGSGSFDLSIEGNYFWERGGDLEWEETDYLINGSTVRWKNFPELPLFQPVKVMTLPLDLTLDRTYRYRRVGRDRVGGREAYVLEFSPADPDAPASLYRGRVWIDAQSFVRLKNSVIQLGLEPPVVSNEEIDLHRPQAGPGGEPFWMLTEIDGQQSWKVAGENFVVRREMLFENFIINPPVDAFVERRQEAYVSDNKMLRDTDQGFRYLDRTADGSRVVDDDPSMSQWLAGGGAFEDNSTDGVRPLAGVNYINLDLWGRGLQFNAFFAGLAAFVTLSDPDLFGSKFDGTVDATLLGFKFEDKIYDGEDELLGERIDTRSQNVTFQAGRPLGQFFRVSLQGALVVRQYFDNDDAEDLLDGINDDDPARNLAYLLPEDHLETAARVQVEFSRRGYSLAARARWAWRSEWDTFGLQDTLSGEFGSVDPETGVFVPGAAEPVQDDFFRWSATGFKEWYLPKFQKIRGELNYLDGANFDRFSRYGFGLFGDDRVNGFAGSGVRFDRGWIGRTGYSFNLFEIVRLDATYDYGRVEREDDPTLEFSGVGLAANFVAPWKTIVSFSYGRALTADISELEGNDEFLLIILKLF
ncbi:MAG: hypothetical protein GY716_01190 [bacterium]|nr:hypothetical protein [bacterium]